ncbi:hypothetical protein CA13_32590 [Planctomycetes bacterium CA13]|uniref:Uncharacterized protein n=1 Tax=Novipirellula herctigrandis TaxID=2527986 RepID=A0A5C5Z462_9BACT|nr:hypothetical protein CA13_32590 [Planctomycetes bacterium CA13]
METRELFVAVFLAVNGFRTSMVAGIEIAATAKISIVSETSVGNERNWRWLVIS